MMKRIILAGWILLCVAVVANGYVRLAPSDPAHWHVRLDFDGNRDFDGGVERVLEAGPQALAQLDAIIRATPRTSRLAGSVVGGHVTYVTRSRVLGFPDYTTVQQQGDTLRIFARLRFGRSDLGVNRARVEQWIDALQTGGQTAFLHFAPHRHVQRHLALRHEHAAIDLQADGFAQFHPRA